MSSRRTGTAGRFSNGTLRLWAGLAAVAGMLLGAQIPAALAHINPPDCEMTGVNIVLQAFRGDRVTPISLTETVSDCEEVCFQTVLSKPLPVEGPDTICAFEAGGLTITTPDGVEHDVTPAPAIPCLGGTTQDPTLTPPAGACTPGVTSVGSAFQCYVVTSEDAQAASIIVRTAYEMGLSHSAPENIPDLVSAGTALQLEAEPMCPLDACNTGVCDPQTLRCIPLQNSTPCTDTDGTACTMAGCELTDAEAGTATCVQNHIVAENSTPCEDTDGTLCTMAGCEAGACVQTHQVKTCLDDACNTGVCNPSTGFCVPEADSTPCPDTDGSTCTLAGCEATSPGADTATCVQRHVVAEDSTPCPNTDGSLCTTAGCEAGVCVQTHMVVTCPDDDCNTGVCNPATGRCVPEADSTPCPDRDGTVCTLAGCEPTAPGADTAVCAQDHVLAENSTPCEDTDGIDCSTAGCDGSGTCDQRHIDDCGGCRLTGGGVTQDGGIDLTELAENITGRFGGQVGASCGCIGCFDEFDHVQGNWQFSRKRKAGNFHAKDYNSLICGCDGVFDGRLCNPGDRGPGPEPRRAPANMACFSGVGDFTPNSGNRADRVAFRVQIEDRGEPGTDDVMRIRIWIPGSDETPEGLAADVCCTKKEPDVRQPDIDDGGDLTHGNLQIHPVLPNTIRGRCPPPRGSCQAD